MSKPQEYYQALLDKDSKYEVVFYAGIKTTGVILPPNLFAATITVAAGPDTVVLEYNCIIAAIRIHR